MSDLIDRQAALSLSFANGQYDHENADEHFILGCELYREWLETLPVIKRETGEWISSLSVNGWQKRTCSECGWSKHTDIHVKLGYLYCPNCGADMREEECD